jgi:hypothetical protein
VLPPCLPDLTALDFFGGRGEEELCEVNWSARESQNHGGLMFLEAAKNIQPHHLLLLTMYSSALYKRSSNLGQTSKWTEELSKNNSI